MHISSLISFDSFCHRMHRLLLFAPFWRATYQYEPDNSIYGQGADCTRYIDFGQCSPKRPKNALISLSRAKGVNVKKGAIRCRSHPQIALFLCNFPASLIHVGFSLLPKHVLESLFAGFFRRSAALLRILQVDPKDTLIPK